MRGLFAAVVIATLGISAYFTSSHHAYAQKPEATQKKAADHKEGSLWMKEKLMASNKILEGLTRGDFEMIAKSAQGMQNLSYLEGWVRAGTPEYKAEIHAFGHATGALVLAAKDKNLEGATLAYNELAISCVRCHKIVRDKVAK